MNGNLHQMIDDIRVGVDQISTAASEIVAGNTDLSSCTEQQAAAVEQTAASMEQLTATVKQNADNANHANKLVVNASQTAKHKQGGEQVGHVVPWWISNKAPSALPKLPRLSTALPSRPTFWR